MNVNWRTDSCVGKAHYMRVACNGQPMWSTLSMWTLSTLLSQSTVFQTATQSTPLPSAMLCMVHGYNLATGRNHEGRKPLPKSCVSRAGQTDFSGGHRSGGFISMKFSGRWPMREYSHSGNKYVILMM